MILSPLSALAAQQPSWTPLYTATPDRPVGPLYVVQRPSEVIVYVTGPSDQLERVSTVGGGGGVPQGLLPQHGVSARFLVSAGGTRLARVDYLPDPDGVRTQFTLFDGEGTVVGHFELPRHASFHISDDGSTVTGLQTGPLHSAPSLLTVHDSNGQERSVPWPGTLPPPDELQLRLSGNGRRLAVRIGDEVAVYDCSGGGPDEPLHRVQADGAVGFTLSPNGSLLALRRPREVVFFQDGQELLHVPTQAGPPIDVAFDRGGRAAVLERAAVHLVDLVPVPVVEKHLAPPGHQYTSVDLRSMPTGTSSRVALGLRRRIAAAWDGSMEVVQWRRGSPLIVRAWPTFHFEKAPRTAPRVSFLPDGSSVLVATGDRVLLSSEVR